MTVTGTTVGSLFYMSPEQVKGGTVDARSDLYSLGVSLYEMVTGQRPFKADSDFSLMTAQVQERPKPPSELRPELPGQLNGIILHSMAKEPAERFQSADEFRQALDSLSLSPRSPVPVVESAPLSPIPLGATSVITGAPREMPPAMDLSTPLSQAPVPSVMDLSPRPSKGRGLYMALGAVTVLAVLVLAGLSFPRWLKTRANEQKAKDQNASGQITSQPADTSANSQPTDTNGPAIPNAGDSNSGAAETSAGSNSSDAGAGSAQPAGSAMSSSGNPSGGTSNSTLASSRTPSAIKGSSPKKSAKSTTSSADNGGAITAPVPAVMKEDETKTSSNTAQNTEPMEELEQDVDQISSRAVAASDSLDGMRRELGTQGLNLRGDIASSEELMKSNLDKARRALQNQDAKNARRYLTMAQAQMEKIEKFLGH
jgi:serine/threonine-protein kinase